MTNVLLIDNYDSFTYNLVQLVEQSGNVKITVIKNDRIEETDISKYQKVIISPGSGLPSEAGGLMLFLQKWAKTKSILGICLGHQAIAEFFGGKLFNLNQVIHGIAKPTIITADTSNLLRNITSPFDVGLYHSWAVSHKSFPDCLEITAQTNDGIIMALRHKTYNICGLQFHPESIMTPIGKQIIKNWLSMQ